MTLPNVPFGGESGWSRIMLLLNSGNRLVTFDVNREAERGDLIPALARLCVRIARRRAERAAQKSQPESA